MLKYQSAISKTDYKRKMLTASMYYKPLRGKLFMYIYNKEQYNKQIKIKAKHVSVSWTFK